MHKLLPLLLLLLFSCEQKPTINKEKLAKELDSIMIVDQQYRSQIQDAQQAYGWDSPEMQELLQKQNELDESNLKRIQEIIDLVDGYPGKSLVGISSSKVAFFVLQHAPDSIQEQYYDLIIQAASEGELDKRLAAMYQDRYLMYRGDPQLFGTQIRTEYELDSITGERIESTYLWPISDTTNIDSVRMWNGLGPLEEYLNGFGISRWEQKSAFWNIFKHTA
ncbi:MAG: hypothetical protein CMP48_10355 [Rickettsiales bacterium]|nr:hypothetical protein [Rickettsiales bacterium]